MRKIVLTLSGLMVLLSCQNDNNPPPQFKYPLAVGNQWEYRRLFWGTNFRPDSLADFVTFPDTLVFYAQVKDTVRLEDNREAIPLSAVTDDEGYPSIRFYRQDESALYEVAYLPSGYLPIFPKKNGVTYKFKGKNYTSLAQLSKVLGEGLPAVHLFRGDSLVYNTPPRMALKYPLFVGSRWNLTDGDFRIEKNIIDYGPVNVAAGDFEAYTIQWLYYFENAEKPDPDLALFDFISKQGLIKRRMRALNVAVTIQTGEEVGYFDLYDESELSALAINSGNE
ncbi:MAG TPA: hypothetical protein EYP36_09590 [Calditrichaeota bacterium]|nr:hypothetical protein [Calditrichota bacterium]